MPKPTHDLRMIVASERSYAGSDCVTFKAHVVYVNQEIDSSHPVGALLNPQRGWGDAPIAHLADLVVTAQRNTDDDGHRWYAFTLAYDRPYRVELRELETMIKGLRAITRKMDRLAERFGRPADLHTFLAHAADAIGCTDRQPFGQYRREPWPTGEHYRWGDAETLRYWLDKM